MDIYDAFNFNLLTREFFIFKTLDNAQIIEDLITRLEMLPPNELPFLNICQGPLADGETLLEALINKKYTAII